LEVAGDGDARGWTFGRHLIAGVYRHLDVAADLLRGRR